MPTLVARPGIPPAPPFLAFCAVAGALAVPPHVVFSAAAALAAAAAGWLGLRIWRWSGVPQPWPSAADARAHRRRDWRRHATSFALGLAFGAIALAVVRLLLEPGMPDVGARLRDAAAQPLWRRAATVYVAAVGEELAFRVILLSLVVGVLTRILPQRDPLPDSPAVGGANALSALLFGAAHMNAWGAAAPASPDLALVVLALNALGGIVFGGMLVRRGVAAAMLAHAGADCVLVIMGPLAS